MSGFLLDTNVPSETIRLQPEPQVQAWIAAQNIGSLYISAVSLGEIVKGIVLLEPGKRRTKLETWLKDDVERLFSGRILPLTPSIARRWGMLDAERERAGRPLGVPDGQIAATALEHDLTLVTRNVRDFQDLGLDLLNPWKTRLAS